MTNKFYITTPIYYINAEPHIGHAYTTISADVLNRYHRFIGDDSFFLTGVDEHGEKNQESAKKAGLKNQEYADRMSAKFQMAWDGLGIGYDNFIRTTDKKHIKAVEKALQYLYDKKYIYKGEYSGLYCSGCEQFKTEKDLISGLCPDHKTRPTMMSQESYMFRLSAFASRLEEAIKEDELLISPVEKKNEILSFYREGLNDISFSRRIEWGVKLPWDKSQSAYVWPDAFLNYLTGLGWDGAVGEAPKMWPADIHLMSKDILRVHATIWPAMILALGLSLPRRMFIHGFFLVDSQKMSKSIGNVIAPDDLIKKYGTDGARYLLASATVFGQDGDVGFKKFNEKYNADLANGLGNLLARSITLAEKTRNAGIELRNNGGGKDGFGDYDFDHSPIEIWAAYQKNFSELKIDEVLILINKQAIKFLDNYISITRPWELIKRKDKRTGVVIYNILEKIRHIALMIWPFMPTVTERILSDLGIDPAKEKEKSFGEIIRWGGLPLKIKTKKSKPLFPRI